MLEVLVDRRITRSLSVELQARAQAQAQAQAYTQVQPDHAQGQFSGVNGGMGTSEKTPMIMRNCSEEIFLRSLMEAAQMAPSDIANEGMNFLGPSQPSRVDSEELFSSWLSATDQIPVTSELPPVLPVHHRLPQPPSRKISHELAALLEHQSGMIFPPLELPRFSNFQYSHSSSMDSFSKEHNNSKPRNAFTNMAPQHDPSSQLMNWFNQSQTMTRSRSSELRRKYLAMQEEEKLLSSATKVQRIADQRPMEFNQAFESLGSLTQAYTKGNPDSIANIPQQPTSLPLQERGNSVSKVVSMLKGSLDRKKNSAIQQKANKVVKISQSRPLSQEFEDYTRQLLQPNQNAALSTSVLVGNKQLRPGMFASHPQSPSDSSGGAPALSTGAANSEGPCNSDLSASFRKNFVNNFSIVDQPLMQNDGGSQQSPTSNCQNGDDVQGEGALQAEFQKRQPPISRAGSLNSCKSDSAVNLDGSSKRRRVERKRMMTEAKGRGYTLMMPSDVQAAIKRCDALEKELRSLKLNLSFMNRKDSEQTKLIEELEKRNEELSMEKDMLVDKLAHVKSNVGSGRVTF